jgi:hypothetical protein
MAIQEKMLKNGHKRFKVRVRDHCRQWYNVTSFKLKRDAERYERELLEKRDHGEVSLEKNCERPISGRLHSHLGGDHAHKGQCWLA